MELSESEFKVLSDYKFLADDFVTEKEQRKVEIEILCIRRDPIDKSKWTLEKISRTQIRWWQAILAFFGWGNLLYSTQDVGRYLNTRNLSKLDPDSPAFANVHHVASRLLAKRDSGYVPLWHQICTQSAVFTVSDISKTKGMDKRVKCSFDNLQMRFTYYYHTYHPYEYKYELGSRQLRLYWNSLAKIEHLKMQISALTKVEFSDIESTCEEEYFESNWDAFNTRRSICSGNSKISAMLEKNLGFNCVIERNFLGCN